MIKLLLEDTMAFARTNFMSNHAYHFGQVALAPLEGAEFKIEGNAVTQGKILVNH